MPDALEVRAMFGRIAHRYDFLNRVLSMGIDRAWRRALLKRAGSLENRIVVDSACGTGDLALVFSKAGARVIGVDFTYEMLLCAGPKASAKPRVFIHADALALPVASAAADYSSIAFGIRNVADRIQGLRELARVVKPGGKVLVLEFSMPRGRLLGSFYRFYFTRILPRIGGLISGDAAAYRYLPDTVLSWPQPQEFQTEMESVGLIDCGFQLLSGGIACLSYGSVAELGERSPS